MVGICTTLTGYVIRFKDPESVETARNNTECLNELGNDTKLVKPRFGIVVHRISTEDFDLEANKTQAVEKIMEENKLVGGTLFPDRGSCIVEEKGQTPREVCVARDLV